MLLTSSIPPKAPVLVLRRTECHPLSSSRPWSLDFLSYLLGEPYYPSGTRAPDGERLSLASPTPDFPFCFLTLCQYRGLGFPLSVCLQVLHFFLWRNGRCHPAYSMRRTPAVRWTVSVSVLPVVLVRKDVFSATIPARPSHDEKS